MGCVLGGGDVLAYLVKAALQPLVGRVDAPHHLDVFAAHLLHDVAQLALKAVVLVVPHREDVEAGQHHLTRAANGVTSHHTAHNMSHRNRESRVPAKNISLTRLRSQMSTGIIIVFVHIGKSSNETGGRFSSTQAQQDSIFRNVGKIP